MKQQKNLTRLQTDYYVDTPVKKWVVGVTSAPRKIDTLDECVESLVENGWNPYVFAEPKTFTRGLPTGVRVVQRPYRYGAWFNWLLMCWELLVLYPDADTFMTVQDDTVFCSGCKAYVERDLWPSPNVGFVSLYAPKHYQIDNQVVRTDTNVVMNTFTNADQAKKYAKRTRHPTRIEPRYKPNGCHRIVTNSLWGACALIFPRNVLIALVNHYKSKSWRGVKSAGRSRPRADWEVANVDTLIGGVMNSLGKEMWFYQPSLTQHVAVHSTLGHGGNKGRRSAQYYIGNEFTRERYNEQIYRPRYTIDGKIRQTKDYTYNQAINLWCYTLGNDASKVITYHCWQEIEKLIDSSSRVLEFGSGLSTILFNGITSQLTSIESSLDILIQLKHILSNGKCQKGDFKRGQLQWQPDDIYDLIFVDGPTSEDKWGLIPIIGKCISNSTVIVVNDTHLQTEKDFVENLCLMFDMDYHTYNECGKTFKILRKKKV